MKKDTFDRKKFSHGSHGSHFDRHFYGLGTVGEKGQIVIPAKAREELAVKSGDQFIFFGHSKVIHLIKAGEIDSFFDKITKRFARDISSLRQTVKKNLKNKQ